MHVRAATESSGIKTVSSPLRLLGALVLGDEEKEIHFSLTGLGRYHVPC